MITEDTFDSTRIEIPPRMEFLGPTDFFILKFAQEVGIGEKRREELIKATEKSIRLVMQGNEKGSTEERIGIEVGLKDGGMRVEVINRGVPLFLSDTDATHREFLELAKSLDSLQIENQGRKGQRFVLFMKCDKDKEHALIDSKVRDVATIDSQVGIEIRELKPGEEVALSQLFYYVYGYQYINDFVYYPERILKLIEEKKLISVVAATRSGRLVGHVGLLKWGETPPVFEPCLGVVDPRMKSKGLFGTLFQETMDTAKEIKMQYLVFDFVTNHDYSQRFVARYGPCDLALFVGCQSKDTQAKLSKLGLGEDSKEMDRYTLLMSVIPQVEHPFGQEILLPNNIGEMVGFLLEPLHMKWSPASRFQLLKSKGDYRTEMQPAQNAVVFDLFDPGREAVNQILSDWHQLLRSGYQYCGIEVPISAPGLGHLYDILSEHGFFISGFVPYHHGDQLGFRFQSIGHTKVAFDDIKVCTEDAKKLLSIVRSNYERNQTL